MQAKAEEKHVVEALAFCLSISDGAGRDSDPYWRKDWRHDPELRQEWRGTAQNLLSALRKFGLVVRPCDSKQLLKALEDLTITPAQQAYEI